MSDIHYGIWRPSPDGFRIYKQRLDRYILIFLSFLPYPRFVPFYYLSLTHSCGWLF